MDLIEALAFVATASSGLISFAVIVSAIVDAVTHGWVRCRVRGWLMIDELREDNEKTQVFLGDLGSAYNDLAGKVSDTITEMEEPELVRTDQYDRMMSDETDVESGDFLRGGDEAPSSDD